MKGLKVLIVILVIVVIAFVAVMVMGARREGGGDPGELDTSMMASFAALFSKPLEKARLSGADGCLDRMPMGATCVLTVRPGGKFRVLAIERVQGAEVLFKVTGLDENGKESGPAPPEGKMKTGEVTKAILSTPAARVEVRCAIPDPSTKRCVVAVR